MKNSILFLLVIMLHLSSCSYSENKIQGSGNVISKNYNFPDLSEVQIFCICDVELIQGDKNEVVVNVDDNLQEYFIVKQEGQSMYIKTQDKINLDCSKGSKVTIYFKELTKIKSACVGNLISVGNIKSNRIDLDISSVGKTNLFITDKYMYLSNKSVGSLTIEGASDEAEIHNSGIGNVDMENFIVKRLKVENSSIGKMQVYAQDELSINNSGIGKMVYSGNPKIKKLENHAIGTLKKK